MLTSQSPAARAWPVHLRGAPPPVQRRVALLPPKDVALFLPKEQGKETEAVDVCIIKVNKDKDRQAYRAGPLVKG